VIDQTAGDMSVTLGGACAESFMAMLRAARAENPQATIYVKTHPEVSSGRKGGYLTQVQDDERTVVLRQAINPLSLIEQMDRVYVVTSTMGFEALLAGKPVTVFGMPWYAGWGSDRRPAELPAASPGRGRSMSSSLRRIFTTRATWIRSRTSAARSSTSSTGWCASARCPPATPAG
jgi:capsular polysaccharide export protein